MPPKKTSRVEGSTGTVGLSTLTAEAVKSADDSNLLNRLLQWSQLLEGLPAGGGAAVAKDFCEELARREFTTHPTPDVRVLVAEVFAEIVRVGSKGTSAAAAADALPLKPAAVKDVVKLWVETVSRLRTAGSESTVTGYLYHLIETLAAGHAFAGLLPKAAVGAEAVSAMIEALLSHPPKEGEDDTVGAFAQVIADCIGADGAVTETQLQLLMNALSQKAANPDGYRVAGVVLRRREDHLQHAVADFITGAFQDACETLHKLDVAGGEGNDRKAALRRVAGVANLLPECAKASPHLVRDLLPEMAKLLDTTDHPEGRQHLVAALGATFIGQASLASEYPQAYGKVIGAVHDARPGVRLQALTVATNLLLTHTSSDSFWAQLSKPIVSKLADADETVRKAAVNAVCVLAEHAPQRIPASVLESVGARCLDRRPAVRALAIDKLAHVYCALRAGADTGSKVRWIPTAILQSIHLEGGANIVAVEAALVTMLPNPARTAGTTKTDKKGNAPAAAKGKRGRDGASAAAAANVFDYDDDVATAGAAAGTGAAPDASSAARKTATFAVGLVNLCADIQAGSASVTTVRSCFETIETLFRKRAQLRDVVRRFFELRAELKKAEQGSEAAKVKSQQLMRLLEFLSSITHAKGDEWGALLKLKDEKAVKALLHLCSNECTDYREAIADATARVKACTSKDVATFAEKLLMPRLAVPVCDTHVAECIVAVRGTRNATDELAALHALYLLTAAAPQLIDPHVPTLIEMILKDSREHTVAGEAVTMQVLKVMSLIQVNDAEIPAALADRHTDVISALGRICMQSRNSQVAKRAALCLTALFGKTKKAFTQLVKNLKEKLTNAAAGAAENFVQAVASWAKTLQIIMRELPAYVAGAEGEEVFDVISRVLLIAVRGNGPNDELVAKSKRTPPLNEVQSALSEVVDCCAKALTSYLLTLKEASRRGPKAEETAQVLLDALRATNYKEGASATVGACLKRLALHKQLVKLFLLHDLDIRLETHIAMFVTAEHNPYVRNEVQKRMGNHIQKGRADMRMFGLLCCTGLAETSRLTYNAARMVVQATGDKLRAMQAHTPSVSLSDQRALKLFPEYSIPFMVQVLAHHKFFADEAKTNFIGYQRAFHLLFDELLRTGTQVVSFVHDLLRKLRNMDDAASPDSENTRVICDLGLKTLTAILSQRAVGLDTIKPYPGTVLLPQYFVKPADPNRFPADRVYLSESVTVSHQVMFRVHQQADAGGDGGHADDVSDAAEGDNVHVDAFDMWDATPAATSRAEQRDGRSKSRRATTPPPHTQNQDAPRNTTSAAANRKRGGSRSKSVAAIDTSPSDGGGSLEQQLENVVRRELRGKTAAEIKNVAWGLMRKKVVDALDIEMTAPMKNRVMELIAEEMALRSQE
jgi:hypothetical protein